MDNEGCLDHPGRSITLVAKTNGSVKITGILAEQFNGGWKIRLAPGVGYNIFDKRDWTEETPLPTEPGYYESQSYPLSEGFAPYYLSNEGRWYVAEHQIGKFVERNVALMRRHFKLSKLG